MFSESLIDQARRIKAMDIKKVVDDEQWQVIRKSLIGNWSRNHLVNVQTLRVYFEANKNNPQAVRQVLNVLTGSVHRTGKTKNQPETDALRRDVRIHWRNMLGEQYDPQDAKYKTGEI